MRPVTRLAGFVSALAAIACFELSGPSEDEVQSISPILAPSPAVAIGDTMRDSAGKAARLRVLAFGKDGDSIEADANFVVLDTGGIRIADGYVRAERATTSDIRIVGRVGDLQTPISRVRIVSRPDSARDSLRHDVEDEVFEYDPFSASRSVTERFGVIVTDATGKGVPSWPVYFSIDTSTVQLSDPAIQALRLVDDSRAKAVDTTGSAGDGLIRLEITGLAIAPGGPPIDTVWVDATTVIRGDSVYKTRLAVLIRSK